MYDPKFTQKQMYEQYGKSLTNKKKADPKPPRGSGFSGMGADPAERFGGSKTKGLGSKPFERGSTYDVIPTPPQRDDKPDPPTTVLNTVKDKAVELFKFFGGDDPKDTEVDPSKVYRGPMFRGPINPGVIEARIRDAVDYSKAPPLFYTAYGSTYDTVPPVTANKDRVKNAVNAFLKQRGIGGKEYTIKRGDTLSEIAQREGVAIDDLAKINKIENINRILAGETLIIPPPEQVENIKDFVDSVDPDAQFYQSGVPMDQRIFEPELGYDEIPLPSEATVDKKIRGLGARPEVTVTELDPSVSQDNNPNTPDTEFVEDAITQILDNEGGYNNNSSDRGNIVKEDGTVVGTMRGITPETYANYVGKNVNNVTAEEMQSITEDTSREIYKDQYWSKPKMQLLPEELQKNVFDMGVNSGRNAVKILQRLAGMTGSDVDGLIGPDTIRAINEADISNNDYVDARITYYRNLAARDPSQRQFLNGWISRAEEYRD